MTKTDLVNHPLHYTARPGFAGECIEYTRHLPFSPGNAFKYLFRCGEKDNRQQDLDKARWYLQDAINHGMDDELVPLAPKIDPGMSVRHFACWLILKGRYAGSLTLLKGLTPQDLDVTL